MNDLSTECEADVLNRAGVQRIDESDKNGVARSGDRENTVKAGESRRNETQCRGIRMELLQAIGFGSQ